jgi:hypothetical protein
MGPWAFDREPVVRAVGVDDRRDDGVKIGGGIANYIDWRLRQGTREEAEVYLAGLS